MTVANSLIASSSAVAKVNLLGLSRQQLEDFFTDLGEKRFRAQQVMKWIHHQGVIDFADMSNLGKGLREKLGLWPPLPRLRLLINRTRLTALENGPFV